MAQRTSQIVTELASEVALKTPKLKREREQTPGLIQVLLKELCEKFRQLGKIKTANLSVRRVLFRRTRFVPANPSFGGRLRPASAAQLVLFRRAPAPNPFASRRSRPTCSARACAELALPRVCAPV